MNNLMPMLAPLLGLLVLRVGNWRLIFLVQALFSGFLFVTLLLAFDESLPHELRRTFSGSGLLQTFLALLRHPVFCCYALINGLLFACIFCFISTSPLLLIQHMGVSHHLYTVLFALMATGSVMCSLLSARLAQKGVAADRILMIGIPWMIAMSGVALCFQLLGLHKPAFCWCPLFSLCLPSAWLLRW